MAKTNLRPLGDMSLVDCLTECVDDARQLYTDFGLRPYRVKLVWIGWSVDENEDGMVQENVWADVNETDLETVTRDPDIIDPHTGQPAHLASVGVGRPFLAREIELLPTPRVGALTGIGKNQDSVGLTERGTLSVDQISSRLSEDLLMGLEFPFRDLDQPDNLKRGIEFFWEVQEDRKSGYVTPGFEGCEEPQELRSVRHRYHVSSKPYRKADAFQWSVNLNRADGERGREGDTSVIGSGGDVDG